MAQRIQLRRDTAANWASENPTPAAGEACFATDTGVLKVGDGVTAYADLDAVSGDLTADSTTTLTNKTIADYSNTVNADDLHIQVRNDSGSTIPKGTPVYVSGYNVGQELVLVAPADASDLSTMPALGIVEEDLANNATGSLDRAGRISGVDTSAFTAGDILFVSETAGQLTTTRPTAPAITQQIATVLRSHATLGVLDVGSNAALIPASTSAVGGVELATDAETIAGTDTARAVTPAGVAAAIADSSSGYDIVILAGQSNMSGRGLPYSATSDPSHPDVFMWNNATSAIVQAVEPLVQRDTPTGIGPGLSFAKGYAKNSLARGRKVLLVGTAVGGTDLVTASAPTWNSATTGSLFDQSVADAQAALAAADAEGGTNEIVGVLWCQGETNSGTYAQYRTALEALIAAYRTDLGVSDLPFLILSMTQETRASTDLRKWLTAVHATTPFDDLKAGFVDAPLGQNSASGTLYNTDSLHYNSTAQRVAGASLATEWTFVKSGTPRELSLPLDLLSWQTLASDDFTRADGALGSTPVGSYAWTSSAGTVASNQLQLAETTGGIKFAFIADIGTTDYRFTMTCVSGPAGLPMGVVWDRVGTNNQYVAAVDRDLGVWVIYVLTGTSTPAILHVSDTPFANGDTVQVVNIDQACSVAINGTTIHTFSKKPHAVGTTPIRVGAWAQNTSSTSSTWLWDDFLVEVPDVTG